MELTTAIKYFEQKCEICTETTCDLCINYPILEAAKLQVPVEPVLLFVSAAEEELLHCPNCGNIVTGYTNHCDDCGKALKQRGDSLLFY